MTAVSHLGSLLAFSALVSIAFATLYRDDRASRLRFGGKLFVAFLLAAIVAGRLMARLAA